ncbi:MAG: DUF1667 domain-containing protein [Clostridia bacterium]|nr:DUF1667 domain-containing protein [Clostridia bacterium]
MKRNLVCIACPIGCPIEVELNDAGEVLSVTGNTCPRGEAYARTEVTHPVRSLTTSVKVEGGVHPVVPVKTAAPIPKEKMFDCMQVINAVTLQAPVAIGDVVVKDICGLGVDVVATNND